MIRILTGGGGGRGGGRGGGVCVMSLGQAEFAALLGVVGVVEGSPARPNRLLELLDLLTPPVDRAPLVQPRGCTAFSERRFVVAPVMLVRQIVLAGQHVPTLVVWVGAHTRRG